MIFILGLLLAYFINSSLGKQQEAKAESQAQTLLAIADSKIANYQSALLGIQSLFAASLSVERNEFFAYSKQLDLLENFSGINSIIYVERVAKKDLNSFTAQIINDRSTSNQGYPNFKIFPLIEKDDYLITKYVEPELATYTNLLGYDFSSDDIRLATALAARDSGKISASPVLGLISENAPGFLLTIPIYQNNSILKNLEQRRRAVVGYVNASIVLDRLFKEIYDKQNIDWQKINLKIYEAGDDGSLNESNLLFNSSSLGGHDQFSLNSEALYKIKVADRLWLARVTVADNYGLLFVESYLPVVVILASLFLGLAIYLLLYFLLSGRKNMQQMNRQIIDNLKTEEEKFKMVTELADDAIIMIDDQDKIVLWNKGAEKMFGYLFMEVRGKSLHQFIPAKMEHRRMENVKKFGQTGESPVLGKVFELPVLTKDGREVLIELKVSRAKIDNHWHAIGIMRDITQSKKYESQLREKVEQLEKINRLTVERELKMIELKSKLAQNKKNNL